MLHDISVLNKRFKDINPLTAGHDTCSRISGFGPSTREYYLIHYVISGKGVFECSKGIFHLKQGDVFIIRPHEITTYKADFDDPWHLAFVSFDGEVADRLLDNDVTVVEYKENTFFEILECEQKINMREEFLASIIYKILTVIFEGGKKKVGYEKQAKDYILANYMGKISVQGIADMLHINRQYLNRLFKQYTKKSVKEFIIETRMKHAIDLLEKGCSVALTSRLVGYEDPYNFSKMFKKYVGKNPENYKGQTLSDEKYMIESCTILDFD